MLASGSYDTGGFFFINKSILIKGPADRSARLVSGASYYYMAKWGGMQNLIWDVSSQYYYNSRNVEMRNMEIRQATSTVLGLHAKLSMDHVLFTSSSDAATVAINTVTPASGTYDRTELSLNNVTLAGFPVGIDWNSGYYLRVTNSILANTVNLIDTWQYQVYYSLLTDGDQSAAYANLIGNPQFVDAINGDYHLQPTSPAIDTAIPFASAGEEPAPNGYRLNMGFYGGTAEATSALDSDNDGLTDGWEQVFGLDPNTKGDHLADNDGDGLVNALEFVFGTNPINPSSYRTISYYLLNPNQLGCSVSVMGLANSSYVYGLDTYSAIAQYEIKELSTANVINNPSLYANRLYANRPVAIGNNADGTDMPVADWFVGNEFVIPHYRYSHRYYVYSPYGDARITVTTDTTTEVFAPRANVVEIDAGSNNKIAGILKSDLPIVVTHVALSGSNVFDTYMVVPSSRELSGIFTRDYTIAAQEDNTTVTIRSSDGTTKQVLLNAGEQYESGINNATRQGSGAAIHLLADKPVAATQIADGDGIEATAFWSPVHFARRYGLPIDTQYVAISCLVNTTITLYQADGSVLESKECQPDLNGNPGKAYFGNESNGTAFTAGHYFVGTEPFYMIYEASGSNDEKNLMGYLH